VAVYAENLHHDDQRAPRLAGRLGDISGKFVAVGGGELDVLTHDLSPGVVFEEPRLCTVHGK
jgi:hypothetical protein